MLLIKRQRNTSRLTYGRKLRGGCSRDALHRDKVQPRSISAACDAGQDYSTALVGLVAEGELRTCSIVRSTWLAVSSGSAPCGSSPAMATSAPDTCDVPNKALMFNVVDDEDDGTGVGFDWHSNFVAMYGCNDRGDGVG